MQLWKSSIVILLLLFIKYFKLSIGQVCEFSLLRGDLFRIYSYIEAIYF